MKLFSLLGNRQRLDGGAMFGNCPRSLWSRWYPPDAENRIALNCRALLVQEDSGRRVLFEAGVGAFFAPDYRARYGIEEEHHVLLDSLREVGVDPAQIDVIVLSHLHFDHAGGVLSRWRKDHGLALVFENARYVVGERAWQRAIAPHPRDRASFIAELPDLLAATRRVERVSGNTSAVLGAGYTFEFSQGHTPGLMMTRIEASDPGPLHYISDLAPGIPWIHAPITMGYDRSPERLIDEKIEKLQAVAESNEWLFLTHDIESAICRVGRDARGRFSALDARSELRIEN